MCKLKKYGKKETRRKNNSNIRRFNFHSFFSGVADPDPGLLVLF
jgi:hypothetical protein